MRPHFPSALAGALARAPKPRTAAEAEFLDLGAGARLWLTEAAAAGTTRMRVKMAEAVTTAKLVATTQVDWALGHAAVVLSVEALRAVDGPGGAADVETFLSFSGEGPGTSSGTVAAQGPTIAGRWAGSGLRTGRLVFSLRAGAAGSYSVPVRFVLSTP